MNVRGHSRGHPRGRSRGRSRGPTRGHTRGPTRGVKFRGSRALCFSQVPKGPRHTKTVRVVNLYSVVNLLRVVIHY